VVITVELSGVCCGNYSRTIRGFVVVITVGLSGGLL